MSLTTGEKRLLKDVIYINKNVSPYTSHEKKTLQLVGISRHSAKYNKQ